MPRDYYIVLGIEQGASLSEIKKAYRNAIKRYHPDKIGESADPQKFRAAREAYEVLSDPKKRRQYDIQRKNPFGGFGGGGGMSEERRLYEVDPDRTRDVQVVLYDRPMMMTINTLIMQSVESGEKSLG